MVAGIEEMGDVQANRSAVLGVVVQVPGAPALLMLLGGGSGQQGAGLIEDVSRARILERPSQAAATTPAAGPRAGGSFYPLPKYWTSICTTPWYAADFPSTSSHFSIRLAAIGSSPFLLLQDWYIVVWNEKKSTIMDRILLKRFGVLLIAQYQDRHEESDKFNLAGHTMLLLYVMYAKVNLEMGIASIHEQVCIFSSRCTRFFWIDDRPVEDTAPLFGLCHQRWTTTALSLIPRFNSWGSSSLSSVMVLQNLQLSSLHLECIRQIDRRESHPRGINWYGA